MSYLELLEEDAAAGPLHDREQRPVGHQTHDTEGAGPLHLPSAALLLLEMGSNLTLHLQLIRVTAQNLQHQLRHPNSLR